RQQLEHLHGFAEKLHHFVEGRCIPVNDGRGKGLPSDTGLDLLAREEGEGWFSSVLKWFSRWPRSDWSVFHPTGHPHAVHCGEMKKPKEIERLVHEAVAAADKGQALPALSLGRSLWYLGEEQGLANSSSDYSAIAY